MSEQKIPTNEEQIAELERQLPLLVKQHEVAKLRYERDNYILNQTIVNHKYAEIEMQQKDAKKEEAENNKKNKWNLIR